LVWLIIIGTSIWVYFDAKTIGVRKGLTSGLTDMGPFGWFISCLGIWIIAFPAYLATRPKFKKVIEQSPTPTAQVEKWKTKEEYEAWKRDRIKKEQG